MASRTRQTSCVVRLLPLRHLLASTLAQCAALRREAGRCWTALVHAHRQAREQHGPWLSVRALEQLAAGPYALHSQPLQALAQQLDANGATATALRQQEGDSGWA